MKKIISIILAVLFVLSMAACSTQASETPAATEAPAAVPAAPEAPATTEEPAPTEPVWEPGIARAAYGELEYKKFMRGDIVNVIGEWKDYYIVEGEDVDLLVEKRFVRLGSEGEYESWTGYSFSGTEVFGNGYLEGDVLAELSVNQTVNVLGGGEGWLYIEYEGGSGYVDEAGISRNYIVYYAGNGGSGGGGGGGDINLDLVAYFGPEMSELKGSAIVGADGIRGSLCVTLRGDILKVTSYDEEVCNIYLEGFEAKLPRWLVQMEGDAAYESWVGYTKSNTKAYEEYRMRNELTVFGFNDEVKVVDELPMCYVIELADGSFAYVELDGISETMNVYYVGDGGSGGGGGAWLAPIV